MMGKIIDKEDETIEIVFNEKEINELIGELTKLKESKAHTHFNVGKNELLIHHEEDEFLK